MFKINFHCHSNFSDGHNMENMVKEYKSLGFCCAVFTDHIYPSSIEKSVSNNREKFLNQILLADELSKKYNIPIIVGAEVAIGFEEVVVFNHDTIFEIFNIIDQGSKSSANRRVRKSLPDLLDTNTDFSILVHPGLNDLDAAKYLIAVLSRVAAYEKYNQSNDYFSHRPVPGFISPKIQLSNSDCHSRGHLLNGYNIINTEVKTFKDMIKLKKENFIKLERLTEEDQIKLYKGELDV